MSRGTILKNQCKCTAALAEIVDERQRLRVVDDDETLIQVSADGIFLNDFLINFQLFFRKVDVAALQGVVEFLGYGEKVWTSLNDAPAGPNASAVHENGQRRKKLGNAAAI